MDHRDRQRRRRRREEEERARKRREERRAEEYRQRDLRGESLEEFINKQLPGLPAIMDARDITPATVLGYMLKFKKDLRADHDYLARWAAANGKLSLLKTLHAHGADMAVYNNYIPRHLTKYENLPAIIWLSSQNMNVSPYLEIFMAAAAREDNLRRMETLLLLDPKLTVQHNDFICRAAKNGLITILEWYERHGAAFHKDIGNHALRGGHIPVLDFLLARGMDFTACAAETAPDVAGDGNMDVIKWLDDHGIGYNLNVCLYRAANSSHTPLVRYLYDKGGRLDNHFESIVIWFNDHGDKRELTDFLLAKRSQRNAHYVTNAIKMAMAEIDAPVPARPGLTRRFLGKLGL
jgi:hypothetical protein